jgi:ElaB/YqjD/DUF883 family membrane-anchored ribosome-binding protein
MQTITVNLLKATKNTGRKLSVQFNGIRDSRLYQPFDRTPEVAAQQFAAAFLSNAAPSAAGLRELQVGELVSSESVNADYGARIVHRFVFQVMKVETPTTEPTEPTTALKLLEKAYREFGEMHDERNEALRAKWRADETLRAANNKLEDAQCRVDAAHQRLADAAAESLHEMPAYQQIMIAQRLGR